MQLTEPPALQEALTKLSQRQECIEQSTQARSEAPPPQVHDAARRDMLCLALKHQDLESIDFFLSKGLTLDPLPASSATWAIKGAAEQKQALFVALLSGEDDATAVHILHTLEAAGFAPLQQPLASSDPLSFTSETLLQRPDWRAFPMAIAAAQLRCIHASSMQFEDVHKWSQQLLEQVQRRPSPVIELYCAAIASGLEKMEIQHNLLTPSSNRAASLETETKVDAVPKRRSARL